MKKVVFSPRKLDELLGGKKRLINASEIARQAGISSTALSNIRKGEKRPSADTVSGIAYAFQKPIQYFFEDEDIVNQTQLEILANSKSATA
jgi:transcriptional regulator with XRE-family HTH domain